MGSCWRGCRAAQCLRGPRDGKELLCLCHGAAHKLERMKDAGEGGWMKVTGELEKERSVR